MILNMALQEISADELHQLNGMDARHLQAQADRSGGLPARSVALAAREFLARIVRTESQIAAHYSGGIWSDATEREVLAAIAAR